MRVLGNAIIVQDPSNIRLSQAFKKHLQGVIDKYFNLIYLILIIIAMDKLTEKVSSLNN